MNRARLKAQLDVDEGRRKKPYRCTAGKLSIGVGRNLDDRGLRDSEIDLMLENDIDEAIYECRRLIKTFEDLDAVRQEVLVNMMFNLGYTRLSGFRKMLAALRARNFPLAAREMKDSLWYRQVGERGERLCEAMRTGAFR